MFKRFLIICTVYITACFLYANIYAIPGNRKFFAAQMELLKLGPILTKTITPTVTRTNTPTVTLTITRTITPVIKPTLTPTPKISHGEING